MTITLDLSPETVSKLRSKANALGAHEEVLASQLLQDALETETWDEWEDLEFLRRSIEAGEQRRVYRSEQLVERLRAEGAPKK